MSKQENPPIIDGLVGMAYSSIKIANEIPGTLDKAKKATGEDFKVLLKNQIKIIQSELQETIDAIEANDEVETLDGAGDLFVTAAGLLQIVDTHTEGREALLEICANNLTKFISVFDPNKDQIIKDTIELYEAKGVKVTPVVNTTYNMIAFMDENGKYKKPSTYKAVNLTSYLKKGG